MNTTRRLMTGLLILAIAAATTGTVSAQRKKSFSGGMSRSMGSAKSGGISGRSFGSGMKSSGTSASKFGSAATQGKSFGSGISSGGRGISSRITGGNSKLPSTSGIGRIGSGGKLGTGSTGSKSSGNLTGGIKSRIGQSGTIGNTGIGSGRLPSTGVKLPGISDVAGRNTGITGPGRLNPGLSGSVGKVRPGVTNPTLPGQGRPDFAGGNLPDLGIPGFEPRPGAGGGNGGGTNPPGNGGGNNGGGNGGTNPPGDGGGNGGMNPPGNGGGGNGGGNNGGGHHNGNGNGWHWGGGWGGWHGGHHHWFGGWNGHCSYDHWCVRAPRYCHWWYNYCPVVQTCSTSCVALDYRFVPCYVNGVVVENTRWYLGVSGMFLPGKGLGIETVEVASPAQEIGLAPGMVITSANGVALNEASDLDRAMQLSNGILTIQVVADETTPSQTVDVVLRKISSASF